MNLSILIIFVQLALALDRAAARPIPAGGTCKSLHRNCGETIKDILTSHLDESISGASGHKLFGFFGGRGEA